MQPAGELTDNNNREKGSRRGREREREGANQPKKTTNNGAGQQKPNAQLPNSSSIVLVILTLQLKDSPKERRTKGTEDRLYFPPKL